jgi:hypothetical protein
MISWQGFEQGEDLIGFGVMKQQSFSTVILRQAELIILIRGSKGGVGMATGWVEQLPTRQ